MQMTHLQQFMFCDLPFKYKRGESEFSARVVGEEALFGIRLRMGRDWDFMI